MRIAGGAAVLKTSQPISIVLIVWSPLSALGDLETLQTRLGARPSGEGSSLRTNRALHDLGALDASFRRDLCRPISADQSATSRGPETNLSNAR
jgi:hypothetical protein